MPENNAFATHLPDGSMGLCCIPTLLAAPYLKFPRIRTRIIYFGGREPLATFIGRIDRRPFNHVHIHEQEYDLSVAFPVRWICASARSLILLAIEMAACLWVIRLTQAE